MFHTEQEVWASWKAKWGSLVGFGLDWTCTNSSSSCDPHPRPPPLCLQQMWNAPTWKLCFQPHLQHRILHGWVSTQRCFSRMAVLFQHNARLCALSKKIIFSAAPTELTHFASTVYLSKICIPWKTVSCYSLLGRFVELEKSQTQQWTVLADGCHMPAGWPWITSSLVDPQLCLADCQRARLEISSDIKSVSFFYLMVLS